MDPEWRMKQMGKVVDDFASAEPPFIIDRATPPFVSRETDTMFTLTANLKGYKRENIKIETNKEGSRIGVRGEKPVQDMVMVGDKVIKKGIEMRGFKKVFKVPGEVMMDKINARFNKKDSTLTIAIPKSKTGFLGTRIEEVMKRDERLGGIPVSLHMEENGVDESSITLEQGKFKERNVEERKERDQNVGKLAHEPEISTTLNGKELKEEKDESIGIFPHDQVIAEAVPGGERKTRAEELKKGEIVESAIERKETEHVEVIDQIQASTTKPVDKDEEFKEEEDIKRSAIERKETEHVEVIDQIQASTTKPVDKDEEFKEEEDIKRRENEVEGGKSSNEGNQRRGKKKKCKPCCPAIAGSAILVSISVLVIFLLRTQNPQRKKKN